MSCVAGSSLKCNARLEEYPTGCQESKSLSGLFSFLSENSWLVVSTRRVVGRHCGSTMELNPRHGISSRFGNFKGIGRNDSTHGPAIEMATVTSIEGDASLSFEYETGNASMGPIYACMFWERAKGFHYGADNSAK